MNVPSCLRDDVSNAWITFPLVFILILSLFAPLQASANPPSIDATSAPPNIVEDNTSSAKSSSPALKKPLPDLSGGAIVWCGSRDESLDRVSPKPTRRDEETGCPLSIDLVMFKKKTHEDLEFYHPLSVRRTEVIFDKNLSLSTDADPYKDDCCYLVRKKPRKSRKKRPSKKKRRSHSK